MSLPTATCAMDALQPSEEKKRDEAFETIFLASNPLGLSTMTIKELVRSFFNYGVGWARKNMVGKQSTLISDIKNLLEQHAPSYERKQDAASTEIQEEAVSPIGRDAEERRGPDDSTCAECGALCEKVVIGARTSSAGSKQRVGKPYCSAECALKDKSARQCPQCRVIIHWRGFVLVCLYFFCTPFLSHK